MSSSSSTTQKPAGEISMVDQIKSEYLKTCTPQTMLIDALIVLSIFTGAAQCLYMFLGGSFPFNSFLSGLLACLGTYAFAVSLRLRITSPEFEGVSSKQAFAEFSFCFLTLYFIVACFLG